MTNIINHSYFSFQSFFVNIQCLEANTFGAHQCSFIIFNAPVTVKVEPEACSVYVVLTQVHVRST